MSRSLCCIKYVFYLLCVALLLFNRPAQAASPPIVAAGAFHTMAVDSHGTVWAWGRNEDAQLGFGYRTTIDQLTPVQVTGLSNIVAVAAGTYHTMAVDSHGTVWAWGRNGDGQLGDGTTMDRVNPMPIASLSNIVAVAAGAFHTMAVDSHGTVWAWGRNEDAQLGFGYRTTIDQLTPVQVTGLSNIVAVAAGAFHTVAVDSHGTVWACGCNFLASLEMASPAST